MAAHGNVSAANLVFTSYGGRLVAEHTACVNPRPGCEICAVPLALWKYTFPAAHWYCSCCLAQLPASSILTDAAVVRLWKAVTKRPDTVPLATYRFLSWLKTTCNITAAGVDIVTFLRHPVTAAQADKLTRQMVWDGEDDLHLSITSVICLF